MIKKTIYLVDDDVTFLETTTIALENDYNIYTASSGKECLENVKFIEPDIIVLDVMMRHLSEGIDVAKKLGEDMITEKIPVIMLTGVDEVYELGEQVDKASLHYSAWIEKPVEPEVLKNKIKELL